MDSFKCIDCKYCEEIKKGKYICKRLKPDNNVIIYPHRYGTCLKGDKK